MDKIDRLLDAMEHPGNYAPTDIDAMLQDPEVKEVFDLLDKTKSSLRAFTTPDIDDEWRRFDKKRRAAADFKTNRFASLFSRNVAATVAIAIASFAAVAAIVGVGLHHINYKQSSTVPEDVVVAESRQIPHIQDSVRTAASDLSVSREIIVFADQSLETILDSIAGYYGCKVVSNNEASKSLRLYFRWNRDLSVEETVERLNNFGQINLTVKDKTIKID